MNCTPGSLAYLVYRFEALDPHKLVTEINLGLAVSMECEVFLALADFEQDRWAILALSQADIDAGRFGDPLLGDAVPSPYVSPAGNLYVAVLGWGEGTIACSFADLYIGLRNVWVQNLSATDAVHLGDITITWDAVEGASGYELYYRQANLQAPLDLLSTVSGGAVTTSGHGLAYPLTKEAQPGVEYIYFIVASFPDGTYSRLSGWDTGSLAP